MIIVKDTGDKEGATLINMIIHIIATINFSHVATHDKLIADTTVWRGRSRWFQISNVSYLRKLANVTLAW